MPKMTRSVKPNPNTRPAITEPNVKTAASPSRYTAEASRNQKVGRVSRHSRAIDRTSSTYPRKKPTRRASGAGGGSGTLRKIGMREDQGPHRRARGDELEGQRIVCRRGPRRG